MAVPNATYHLIVFGRYPRAGKVKTRLIPALGSAGAASLQKRLTEKVLAAARSVADRRAVHLVFCYEGAGRRRVSRWLGLENGACEPQGPGSLGDRMRHAMNAAFRRGATGVVLVGTDIPGINAVALQAAFDHLKHADLVLGPSTDGGYWLVGLSQPANIFDGIAWSTSTVLADTLRLAAEKNLRATLLDPMTDVDTPESLAREMGKKTLSSPYLSIIIATLNDAHRIARTIARATAPDAEIIVSDGGSTDRTVAIAASMNARVVHTQPGRAVQLNRGAAAARGDALLFLNADACLPDSYVDHIFNTLMDRRTLLGAFRFQLHKPSPTMRVMALWANFRARWLQLPYAGQGLFLNRCTFTSMGGFPEAAVAEDLLWVRRMSHAGRIDLAPAAITSHRRWQRAGPLRSTIIDMLIAVGCLAGIAPHRLALLGHLLLRKR